MHTHTVFLAAPHLAFLTPPDYANVDLCFLFNGYQVTYFPLRIYLRVLTFFKNYNLFFEFSTHTKFNVFYCFFPHLFRPSQLKELKDQKVFSGVVFKKLIHDPNFYYRSAIEIGEEPPLHVNTIYTIMYPGSETQKQHNWGFLT